MELVNETSLYCHMERLQTFFKDLVQATVIVKASYDVLPSGETRHCAEQPAVLREDTETLYGTVDAELVPVKAWCDLALLGHAWSFPAGQPTHSMLVSLRVATFERVVRVTGDRVWVKSLGSLLASPPASFTKLPLSYARAFGGAARPESDIDFPMPYLDNPDGRGFVARKEDVEGTPLPNIEEVDAPVAAWTDRPLPAGLAPLPRRSGLRAQRGFTPDVERYTARVDASAFCFAHPRMSLDAYPNGAEVEIVGASPTGRWSFRLPDFQYWLRVDLGASRYQLPIAADTLYLLPDEQKVTVVGRRTFIYQFIPERMRTVRVMSTRDATALNAPTSIRELRAAPRPGIRVEVPPSKIMPAATLESLARNHPISELTESFPLCPSA
jgi:hypothetical protein